MNIFLKKKEALKLSYADIGNAIGVDRTFVHNMLNGTRPMPLERFIELALYFGLDREAAISAWKEIETERFKKTLDADCGHIAQAFNIQ